MKNKLAEATLLPIDEAVLFIVETDASNFTIAATLNQNGKPVAFHARTLSTSKQRHSAVEKEAYAVAEALRKWKHLLLGKHFTLITDQRRRLELAAFVVNEFSRFPFAYACPDIKSATVIKNLLICLASLAFLVMCIAIKCLVLCRLN